MCNGDIVFLLRECTNSILYAFSTYYFLYCILLWRSELGLSHIREALFRLFFKNSGVLIIYMDLNNQLNRIFNELLA
jgi:hypothetical protein